MGGFLHPRGGEIGVMWPPMAHAALGLGSTHQSYLLDARQIQALSFGLVLTFLGHPTVGETVQTGEAEIRVEELEGLRVKRVMDTVRGSSSRLVSLADCAAAAAGRIGPA